MDAGDELDLDVTSVAHGGVFVGRVEGRVVFVPDALPGERVRVRLTDVAKKSFWRGEVVEVLDASPHRRPHIWAQADLALPPAERPGGADFGHIDLAHQRALKLEVLKDSLRRFGGVEPGELPGGDVRISAAGADETPDGRGWRTRVSLHVDDDGRVGPFAARSHSVVEVTEHPLATPEIEAVALSVAGARPGRIDLVQPSDGRVRVIPRPDAAARAPREARESVIERVGAREFRVDAGGFWQVHRSAAATLDAAVREAVRAGVGEADAEGWHLDLYGGVGLFAAALGDLGATRLTTVESDARATEHAGHNLAEWVGARAETARVDRFVTRLAEDASARDRARLARGVAVLDPPRSGAGRVVVEAVAALHPAAVVYVACDPVALARDVATFRAAGYDLKAVQAFDLFPNSHHVEAVATLLPGGGARDAHG